MEWCGAGEVICLEQSADDLHMVQLMSLLPIISRLIKIQNGLYTKVDETQHKVGYESDSLLKSYKPNPIY